MTTVGLAAADKPSVTDVLARVGDYVVRYERELSGIVAEERYAQTADIADRPQLTHRELKSDLLLVQAQGRDGQGFIQFRDVFEVDGDSVRDRTQRLVTLFVNPSTASRDQAFAIMRESSRYNIGSVERNVNVPVLALSFMHPRYQSRFKFTMDSEGAGVPRGMPKASNFSAVGGCARAAFPGSGVAPAHRLPELKSTREIARPRLGRARHGADSHDRAQYRHVQCREHDSGELPVGARRGISRAD